MAQSKKSAEELLDLEEEEDTQELGNQVQKAQEQLLMLKRQQDTIEKQKRELEELSRKQDELESGKSEMLETLNRALVVVERESYESHKRYEQLNLSRDSFHQHLETLESINPRTWDKTNLQKELSKALSAVEDARSEYEKSRTKINAESNVDVISEAGNDDGYMQEMAEHDFGYWLKAGFAFTLPLLILGLIFTLIFLFTPGT